MYKYLKVTQIIIYKNSSSLLINEIFEKRIDLHEEKNNQENPFISYYFSINTKWKFSRRKILNFFPNSTSLPTIITFFALLFRKR